jgi:hypothetical protein
MTTTARQPSHHTKPHVQRRSVQWCRAGTGKPTGFPPPPTQANDLPPKPSKGVSCARHGTASGRGGLVHARGARASYPSCRGPPPAPVRLRGPPLPPRLPPHTQGPGPRTCQLVSMASCCRHKRAIMPSCAARGAASCSDAPRSTAATPPSPAPPPARSSVTLLRTAAAPALRAATSAPSSSTAAACPAPAC